MASAIALYPASLGWRWLQESYSGRNIFGLSGSRVTLSKSITAPYALPALIHSLSVRLYRDCRDPAELSGPAQCCSPRTVFQNCSVLFMRGNGASGTGTSRKRHSGAQPSATLKTSSRSAGIAARTSSVRRR
jgi:hypothetical protein